MELPNTGPNTDPTSPLESLLGGPTGSPTGDPIVFDLEATCWDRGSSPDRMETIEIGAVRVDPLTWEPVGEFARFIRPVAEPILSDFCRSLTGITQGDVDGADPFPEVFGDFVRWVGEDNPVLCSWGAYDPRQFLVDCRRHDLDYPATFANHINLKKEFAHRRDRRPCGMKRALNILGLPLEGQHHRGIDDARNIARILKWLKTG